MRDYGSTSGRQVVPFDWFLIVAAWQWLTRLRTNHHNHHLLWVDLNFFHLFIGSFSRESVCVCVCVLATSGFHGELWFVDRANVHHRKVKARHHPIERRPLPVARGSFVFALFNIPSFSFPHPLSSCRLRKPFCSVQVARVSSIERDTCCSFARTCCLHTPLIEFEKAKAIKARRNHRKAKLIVGSIRFDVYTCSCQQTITSFTSKVGKEEKGEGGEKGEREREKKEKLVVWICLVFIAHFFVHEREWMQWKKRRKKVNRDNKMSEQN